MISPEVNVLEDGIIFKFIEDIQNKAFQEKTEWGFQLSEMTANFEKPRWAKAFRVGPKVKYVKVDDYILIEKLQWTNALEYGNDKFWKTNESKVLMVSEDAPTDA